MKSLIQSSISFLLGLCLSLPAFQQGFSQHSGILIEGEKPEVLFDGGFFLEGPAVAPDQSVYFSDITFTDASGMQAGHIWRYDPATGKTELFRSPSGMSNGIIFDRDGNLLIAQGADSGGRAIIRTDMQTGKSYIVANRFEEKRFNSPNDLVIDAQGRIYFTDPRYAGDEPMELPTQGVYRIDPDGSVHRIIPQNGTPNGIVISPDQKYVYVASINGPDWMHFNGLVRYGLDDAGNASNRKVLIEYEDGPGPDGMTVDMEGNLYLARPADQPGIYIHDAEGKFIDMIPLPESPTNVTFGHGPTANNLYITAGKSLYQIRVNAKGFIQAYQD